MIDPEGTPASAKQFSRYNVPYRIRPDPKPLDPRGQLLQQAVDLVPVLLGSRTKGLEMGTDGSNSQRCHESIDREQNFGKRGEVCLGQELEPAQCGRTSFEESFDSPALKYYALGCRI